MGIDPFFTENGNILLMHISMLKEPTVICGNSIFYRLSIHEHAGRCPIVGDHAVFCPIPEENENAGVADSARKGGV